MSPTKRAGHQTTTGKQLPTELEKGSVISGSEFGLKTPNKSIKKGGNKKRIRIDGEAFHTDQKVLRKVPSSEEQYDA